MVPGMRDYKILDSLKMALSELGLDPAEVVVASGIGRPPRCLII